jgi:hypothetical protein
MRWRDKAPFHLGKEFLGVTVTLAIIGAYLLLVTNGLARRCAAGRPGPGTCSGMSAFASHVHGIVTIGAATCAALAVIAFVWYMIRGYRAGRARGYHDV